MKTALNPLVAASLAALLLMSCVPETTASDPIASADAGNTADSGLTEADTSEADIPSADQSIAEIKEEVKADPCAEYAWILEYSAKWECPTAANGMDIQLEIYEENGICMANSKLFGPIPAEELECNKDTKQFTFYSKGHDKKAACTPSTW